MILFGASCLALIVASVAVTSKDPTAAQIDAIFARYNHTTSPGCAVAVERDGQLLYAKGFGMANLDYDVPNTPSTVFHVASLSKQFTAFAIQLLVEDGKLGLDDDIRKYLPEMHDFGKTITIQNLLHHTSGLRDQWNLVSLGGWRMDDVITQDDLLDLLFRQQALSFDPGSHYLYCNSNYTLLAEIVKRVSGKSLADFCEEHIFVPLKMAHTHFHDDYTEVVPNRAVSYDPKDGGGFQMDVLSYSNVGATSLYTTVEDFAKWSHNFDDPKVGGPNVMKRMIETRPLTDGREDSYASGLAIGTYRGLPIVEHSGGDAGYRADFLRFPEQKLSITCFANDADAAPDQLVRHVAQLFIGALFGPIPTRPDDPHVDVDGVTLKSYSGCYQFNAGSVGSFSVAGGKLQVGYVGRDPFALMPLSATRFRSPGGTIYDFSKVGNEIQCRRDEGNDITTADRIAAADISPNYFGTYVGDYYSEELRQIFRVENSSKGLRLVFLKANDEMAPLAQDLFGFQGWVVRFEKDRHGQVVRLFMSCARSYNLEFARVTLQKA